MANGGVIDLEEGWQRIKEQGIDKLERILDSGMDGSTDTFSNREYMSIYTCVLAQGAA